MHTTPATTPPPATNGNRRPDGSFAPATHTPPPPPPPNAATVTLPSPPHQPPTAQIPATVADYEQLVKLVMSTTTKETLEKWEKKRENIKIDPRAKRYATNIFRGMSPRRACLAAGLDFSTEWGVITYFRSVDPIFREICRKCEEVQRQRIRDKALGVIEETLDGGDVGKQAARVACEICIERGVRHDGGTPAGSGTGSPQVIINMPALPVSCCNSVATNGATVFTAKIVDNNAN